MAYSDPFLLNNQMSPNNSRAGGKLNPGFSLDGGLSTWNPGTGVDTLAPLMQQPGTGGNQPPMDASGNYVTGNQPPNPLVQAQPGGTPFDLDGVNTGSSYSGTLGANAGMIGGWLDNLSQMLDPQAWKMGVNNTFDNATSNVQGHYQDQMNYLPYLLQNSLQPKLQQAMNQSASRGMFNSSQGDNLIQQAMRGALQDQTQQQFQLGSQQAQQMSALEGDRADALNYLPKLLSESAQGIGRYSEADQGQASLLAALFPSLIQYGDFAG